MFNLNISKNYKDVKRLSVYLVTLLLLCGLFVIIRGGDIFVTAAVNLARITGIPRIIIGATIVSFATTLPELLISALAVAQGSPDLCIGNNIGSIIFNTSVILAISLIFCPHKMPYQYKNKGLLMLFSVIFLLFAALDLNIGYFDAAILIIFLIIFIRYCISDAKISENKNIDGKSISVFKTVGGFITGAALIALGAQLLISNSIALAHTFNVPERVIGLTIVGMGSSLPELITTISSLRKKEYSIGLGNILGANVLNITFIPAVCALISKGDLLISLQKIHLFPYPVPTTLYIDIPFAVLIISAVVIPGIVNKYLCRRQGILLLSLYAIYTVFLFLTL